MPKGTASTRDLETVIVDGLRTPFGKLKGALSGLKAVDLVAPLLSALLENNGVSGEAVDEVILGQVIQAGGGQNPARHALIKAGMPVTCEAITVNKACASSMRAVTFGDLRIRAADAHIILAGGMESMSQAPFLVDATVARFGQGMGHAEFKDSMLADGLECPIGFVPMTVYAARAADEFGISREAQDALALRSQVRASQAQQSGVFAGEIFPLSVAQGKGQFAVVDQDEAPRAGTTLEALAGLRPLTEGGTITAGNAPGVNDGAACLLLMSAKKARELGLKPLARIVSHASLGQDVPQLATVPALATQRALKKAGLEAGQLELLEINEAFATVALKSTEVLGVDPELVNVNGGAIALGHPVGASGARILLTLAKEMERRGATLGAAAICSAMAQGDAVILSREGLD